MEPPDFDLATDAWVIVDGADVIVGYGQVTRQEPASSSRGDLHPAHRGRGLGSSLVERIEERADTLAGHAHPRFRHAINAGDQAAAAMLRAGLAPVRHFWHMGIDLKGTVDRVEYPTDRDRRDRAGEDLQAMHAVLAKPSLRTGATTRIRSIVGQRTTRAAQLRPDALAAWRVTDAQRSAH